MAEQTEITTEKFGAIDCVFHKRDEVCPGMACPNGVHRFDAFLRTHCHVCGGPDDYAHGVGNPIHAFWGAYKKRAANWGKPLGKKAKGPKAKPLDHYQIAHNLLGWYKADGDQVGLAWLVEHQFANATEAGQQFVRAA